MHVNTPRHYLRQDKVKSKAVVLSHLRVARFRHKLAAKSQRSQISNYL